MKQDFSQVDLSRPLLILDLDETLVHAKEKEGLPGRQPDHRLGSIFIYKRPHLAAFLCRMAEHYNLAIWSAGSSPYVEPTVQALFAALPRPIQPVFVWSRNRLTRRYDHEAHEEYFIKELKKVGAQGFNLERTLIVDDLERNSERNFGNAVYIKPFEGAMDDCELLCLGDYLIDLLAEGAEKNFRKVEKRGWRQRYADRR